jgi:protoporphyrinogen oxidase
MGDIKMDMNTNILIVGGGPTGIGSAWRLNELISKERLSKEVNWLLIDGSDRVGGSAASQIDQYGFTWDLGSHVIYSRYKYFDDILTDVMRDELKYLERKGWVWMKNRFIPYPLQNNLQLLPPEFIIDSVSSLLAEKDTNNSKYSNFKEFAIKKYGKLLAEEFFIPYICKMFAHPAEDLSTDWVYHASGSKYRNVPEIDVTLLLENILYNRDAPGWANGDLFPYPKIGGSGRIWENIYSKLPNQNTLQSDSLVEVDADLKVALFSSGRRVHYEFMVSTIPLPEILKKCAYKESLDFPCTRAHVVGLGFKGDKPELFSDKMWIYDATETSPYFRLSFPHNYSKYNVPVEGSHWSVLCEISESNKKVVNRNELVADTLNSFKSDFLVNTDQLITTTLKSTDYAYATPSHGRDDQLVRYDEWLTERGIFSRGRFGNWKYECGNQDSSFMQGVEVVDKILFGVEEVTHQHPELIGTAFIDRTIDSGIGNG